MSAQLTGSFRPGTSHAEVLWDGVSIHLTKHYFAVRKEMLERAYEGFCPLCPDQRLKITDEKPDSPHYADVMEAAVGEAWAEALLHCDCCLGCYSIRRGEPEVDADYWHDGDWRDGYVAPPCEHVGKAVDEAKDD